MSPKKDARQWCRDDAALSEVQDRRINNPMGKGGEDGTLPGSGVRA